MQAHNLVQFPNQLQSLEDDAQAALDDSIKALSEFVSILETIQDSALWQKDYTTWRDYLKTRWGLSDSTLRSYRATLRTGDMIMQIVADVTPSKQEVDKVKRTLASITSDKELQASTYAKAYEHTGKIAPSETELRIAYTEIERTRKHDVLTIDGIDYNAKALVIDDNIKQELYELGKRKAAHIDASQGIESKHLEIGQKEAITALFKALGMDVPQGRDFVLFWKEKVGE